MPDAVRPRLRLRWMLASGFACILLVTTTACAAGSSHSTSLSELVGNAATYNGRLVRASGTVRRFQDSPQSPPYVVLEDAAHNRVLLSPPNGTQNDVGRHVVVEGCFTYSDSTGQQLAVTRIVVPKPSSTKATVPPQPCAPVGGVLTGSKSVR